MQNYLALCALMFAGCGSVERTLDGAVETADAPKSDIGGGVFDAGDLAVFDGGVRDAGPPRDTGPSGPDVPMLEDCEMPGDEDADRRADCDDPDCWSGCAAVHVARMHPALMECGPATAHTVAESRDVCLTYSGDAGDAPTLCIDSLSYASTARFFCDAEGETRALWLEERLSLPPLARRDISATTFEFTSYEHTPERDVTRVAQGSGSGPRDAELNLRDGIADPVLISVYAIESGDVTFERMVGGTRLTETVTGEPPRVAATRRELFRTGGTRLLIP